MWVIYGRLSRCHTWYHGESLCFWQGAEASKGPQASWLHRFCTEWHSTPKLLQKKPLRDSERLWAFAFKYVQLSVSSLEDGTKEVFVKAPGAPPSQAWVSFNSCWLSWYYFWSACPLVVFSVPHAHALQGAKSGPEVSLLQTADSNMLPCLSISFYTGLCKMVDFLYAHGVASVDIIVLLRWSKKSIPSSRRVALKLVRQGGPLPCSEVARSSTNTRGKR